MTSIFEYKDRKVLPNFRSLIKTAAIGELAPVMSSNVLFQKSDIQDYVNQFLANPEVSYAGDLISAAIINNEKDNKTVISAAEFLLKNENQSTVLQQNAARLVLGISEVENKNTIKKIEEFINLNTDGEIRNRIKELKALSRMSLSNPFIFTELSRLYSIVAQKDKAIENLLIAKTIAPNNRYIIRSFARLMTHLGDFEYAHDLLKKGGALINDPWVLASEISLASLRGKTSFNIKKGLDIIKSNNFSPLSISELASAIGTIDITTGNHKKSRELFRKALIQPNDNTLAQVEWANKKFQLFDFDVNNYDVSNNYEAQAFDSFYKNQLHASLGYIESWFIDMPFATRPISLGSHIATVYLEEQEISIKFCKAGLISNPNDPIIINNIAYSYCLLDDPQSAFEYLKKVDLHSIKGHEQICLKATTGLAYFRSGAVEQGRQMYIESIREAREQHLDDYAKSAFLNYVREEARINSHLASELIKALKLMPNNNPEFSMRKNRILKAYGNLSS